MPAPYPRRVFERLFGDGKPGERAANLKRRLTEDKSALGVALMRGPHQGGPTPRWPLAILRVATVFWRAGGGALARSTVANWQT